MKTKPRQSGLTLVEMTTVIAIVALLTAFAIPVMRTFFDSLGSAGNVKGMISAALASARAIAAKEQKYAGVRFQRDLEGHQYMVFILNDPEATGLAWGFCVVEGIQPVKLPDNIGVMDLNLGSIVQIIDDDSINDNWELTDTTAFSIIFSPSGNLVIHDVRVRNRDGKIESTQTANNSMDDIFNTQSKVTDLVAPVGMFIQDDYQNDGLFEEPSRKRFIIYDKIEFGKVDPNRRWTDYLRTLDVIYINPYTGTIVSADR